MSREERAERRARQRETSRRWQARKHRAMHGEARVRHRARVALNNALQSGRVVKGPCERQGPGCDGPVHAHHEDYAAPLDVRWLCREHHRAEHAPPARAAA